MTAFDRKPRVSDALRSSLLGWGATSWISPRRQRVVKAVLPVTGFVLGVMFALIARSLGDSLNGTTLVLMAVTLAVMVCGYVVYDLVFGLEMLEKRAVESDLGLARQIQRRMLPDALPEPPGYEIAAHHEPARAVGGDAYDALLLDDGRLLFAVADVSGKGASAALLMMGVLARLRALARTGMDVAALAHGLNTAMTEETEIVHFATLVVGELDPATGRVDYVNAGNTPPLLVRADGSLRSLESGGLPVGMLPDAEYEAGRVDMQPGDRLLLITDGVQDADETGEVLFDDEDLRAFLHAERDRTVPAVVEKLARRVHDHHRDDSFDDVTILLLGRRAQGSGGLRSA